MKDTGAGKPNYGTLETSPSGEGSSGTAVATPSSPPINRERKRKRRKGNKMQNNKVTVVILSVAPNVPTKISEIEFGDVFIGKIIWGSGKPEDVGPWTRYGDGLMNLGNPGSWHKVLGAIDFPIEGYQSVDITIIATPKENK